jgi:selenocysteine-specific elongation factor
MLTIGTAGHIDHGKSSLVKTLTSIDPDRLPEEKRRGMTIDLGFAWLRVSSGEMVGIVDVPGHKHFIHNVIPGLVGIDAVLLVVAADDGWMPQTEEHVQILNLLGVEHGIVALTKIDLIDDREWLAMVEREIAERLAVTSLKDAPIIKVSTRDGSGIPELKKAIDQMAVELAPRKDIGQPRLPIDRVFTMKGSGVVVTGTLTHGHLSAGDDVFISPGGQSAHIRSIESYKQQLDTAQPGSRVALNLTGVKKGDLGRGDIVMSNAARMSRIVDIKLRLLPGLEAPLKNNSQLVVYLETRELPGRVLLFGRKEVLPAETALAQLRLEQEVAAYIGQHFIVRRQSPAITIGGGVILDPLAAKFKIKDSSRLVALLERRKGLSLEELVLTELEKHRYIGKKEMLPNCCYSAAEIADCVEQMRRQQRLVTTDAHVIDINHWRQQGERFLDMLRREHSANPLKKGLSRALLQSYLDLPREAFNQLVVSLVDASKVASAEDFVSLAEHRPQLTPEQEAMSAAIMELFKKSPGSPPTKKEVAAHIPGSEAIVRFLCQQGILIELPEGVLFETKHYHTVEQEIIDFMEKNGQISIQDVNSLFGFSRKYTIPLLSYLDKKRITRRQGNVRVPVKKGE